MTLADAIYALHHYVGLLDQLELVLGQGDMVPKANALQQFYHQQLGGILIQLEYPQQTSQWRSAVTEIHRHMRLLAVEVRFAQSAQQQQTSRQRLQQIEQRLKQLKGFARGLLTLAEND